MRAGIGGIFAVQSYLAAEAYAQIRLASVPVPSSDPALVSDPEHETVEAPDRSFIHFQIQTFHVPADERNLYRHSVDFNFAAFRFPDFPSDFVPLLYDLTQTTGCRHSLFRHHNRFGPLAYEIRRGTAEATDFLALGGEIFSEPEERFFGTDFVAHTHIPGQNPHPSLEDLGLLLKKSRQSPGRLFRHIILGFEGYWPVATLLCMSFPITSSWNPSEDPGAR